jgi:putative transcriptional regulator
MPQFRTRLRVLRAERKWSQAKLPAQVGVTRQAINYIEKGRFHPNLRLAFKIALLWEADHGSVYLRGYLRGFGRLTRYPRTGIIA